MPLPGPFVNHWAELCFCVIASHTAMEHPPQPIYGTGTTPQAITSAVLVDPSTSVEGQKPKHWRTQVNLYLGTSFKVSFILSSTKLPSIPAPPYQPCPLPTPYLSYYLEFFCRFKPSAQFVHGLLLTLCSRNHIGCIYQFQCGHIQSKFFNINLALQLCISIVFHQIFATKQRLLLEGNNFILLWHHFLNGLEVCSHLTIEGHLGYLQDWECLDLLCIRILWIIIMNICEQAFMKALFLFSCYKFLKNEILWKNKHSYLKIKQFRTEKDWTTIV